MPGDDLQAVQAVEAAEKAGLGVGGTPPQEAPHVKGGRGDLFAVFCCVYSVIVFLLIKSCLACISFSVVWWFFRSM